MKISTNLPLIGEPWPGQGGIFAGIRRNNDAGTNHAVILAVDTPPCRLAWPAALAWAATVEADGHRDFVVPDRWDSALLYATVREHLNTDERHWTGTQYSDDCAWTQFYGYGNQDCYLKVLTGRVRAVRLIQLDESQS